jgi:putative NIF3 family GTP cyclohydrolase 1 type 2
MKIKFTGLLLIILTLSASLSGQPNPHVLTATQVIDLIKKNVKCSWSDQTVDTFKSGNPEDAVTGIATCMFADMKALKLAVASDCNLIITHEPTFYNHLDEIKLLEGDPVYEAKIKYIKEHKLIIFRFHDHIHRMNPDGIYAGMVEKLGWVNNRSDSSYDHFAFKTEKLSAFVSRLKSIFPGSALRVVGDPDLLVTNVALSAGAAGSAEHIRLLQDKNTQVLIAGEAPEWETYQYVYDAQLQGKSKAVIFLGHTLSEEAGMSYCAKWLAGFIPDFVKIKYFENESSFKTY